MGNHRPLKIIINITYEPREKSHLNIEVMMLENIIKEILSREALNNRFVAEKCKEKLENNSKILIQIIYIPFFCSLRLCEVTRQGERKT